MHWATGLIGYFSTYLLGTVMSVQLWEQADEDLGGLDEQIERGEFAPLREWLERARSIRRAASTRRKS